MPKSRTTHEVLDYFNLRLHACGLVDIAKCLIIVINHFENVAYNDILLNAFYVAKSCRFYDIVLKICMVV